MNFDTLKTFLSDRECLASVVGPVCVVFAEDQIEVASTITHHARIGFPTILLIGEGPFEDIPKCDSNLHLISERSEGVADAAQMLNRLIPALAGKWLYYCFNAEYLYFPFCETRSICDAVAFAQSERRESVYTYSIDLYADDLERYPNAVSLDNAYLDKSGYYGMTRWRDGTRLERELDIFGGLRWRFDEHVPYDRRRIDRISLFLATKGLEIGSDFLLNERELNTISCPWHNNMTMAVMSFRAAKSLKLNPGSTFDIGNFMWSRSGKFDWSSTQLMQLGFMEPGQWF